MSTFAGPGISAHDPEVLVDLAKGYFHLGDLHGLVGDHADERSAGTGREQYALATQNFHAAVRMYDELRAFQETNDDQYSLSVCYFSLARVQADLQVAVKFYEQARDILAPLVQDNPSVDKYRGVLSGIQLELSNSLFDLGREETSLLALGEAERHLHHLLHKHPQPNQYHADMLAAVELKARIQTAGGSQIEQLQLLVERLSELVAEYPDVATFHDAVRGTEQRIEVTP